jgi:hypothetical protein
MRRTLPIFAAVVAGLVTLADFFVADPLIDAVGAVLTEGVLILAAIALIMGVLNLLKVHSQRAVGETKGKVLSGVLIAALLLTLFIGVGWPQSSALAFVFDNVYLPIQSTLAALLAFFVISALYRAFRLRNLQAFLLMISCLVLFLTQLPFSGSISPLLPMLNEWILTVPVTAGVRGIILGTALGTIMTSLRILLAVDHPYSST